MDADCPHGRRAFAEESRPDCSSSRTRRGRAVALARKPCRDAPADGTTLLFAAAAQFTLQPHVIAGLGYDPFTAFIPISRIVKFDQALVISNSIPARSVKDLVAWLKANPEQAAFGSPGSRHGGASCGA